MNKETRYIKFDKLEARADDNGKRSLTGYAAVYDSWSVDLWGFREIIRPGAFKRSIEENDDVFALADHDFSARSTLARRSAGTLRIEEDDTGLKVNMDLPDTSVARDLYANIEAGNINGMSFGFEVREDSWKWAEEQGQLDERELKDIKLYEVSVVAQPAYPATTISAREAESLKSEYEKRKAEENKRRQEESADHTEESQKTPMLDLHRARLGLHRNNNGDNTNE